MRAFLDGSASTFETERVRSPTTFELVPTHCKRAFLPLRYGVRGDSIGGCAPTGPAPQCAMNKRCNKGGTFQIRGISWLARLYSLRIQSSHKKDPRTRSSLCAQESVRQRCATRSWELLPRWKGYCLWYPRLRPRTPVF